MELPSPKHKGTTARGTGGRGPRTTIHGPDEPTFDSGRMGTIAAVLDIALSKGVLIRDVTLIREGSSNHDPILVRLQEETARDTGEFVRRRTDWTEFRAALQRRIEEIPRIETTLDLERAAAKLEEDIQDALRDSTTEVTVRRTANPIGEISNETRDLIRERRTAKRRALRTRLPEDKPLLNQLSRRVKAALDEHRQESWNSHLEDLSPTDTAYWKTQKALRTRKPQIPPLHGERGIVYTVHDKATAFADCFERQCRENQPEDEDEEWSEQAERRARNIRRMEDDQYVFEPKTTSGD